MIKRLISIVFLLFLTNNCSNDSVSSDSNEEINNLIGIWNGIEVNNDSLVAIMEFTSNEFNYTSFLGDGSLFESMVASYTINKDGNDGQIDLNIVSSFVNLDDISDNSYAGLTSLGIFEINSDTLTFAGTEPGLGVRPTSFNQGQNDGYYARVFKLIRQ
tara:strand:+ start:656 stop:1132 length:477 start_codon:yes stop_codon:yes gene_type:complete